MKILYISHYNERSGWSIAAQAYMRSLASVNIDVVARGIKIQNIQNPIVHEQVLQFAQKESSNVDHVIFHVLPHHIEYNSKLGTNIALYVGETSNLGMTTWAEHLNLMDLILYPNSKTLEQLNNSGVSPPKKILEHPCDIDKFKWNIKPASFPNTDEDTFIFYFLGEVNPRKNLEDLLVSFHTEFDDNDNVSLVIKGSVPGQNSDGSRSFIEKMCTAIKQQLRLHRNISGYKHEIINTDFVPDEAICAIHKGCHCLIVPSKGEGWCMPAIDALGYGNPVICGKNIGIDFVTEDNGYFFDTIEEPTMNMMAPLQDIYTAKETWLRPQIMSLRHKMREAYEDKLGYLARKSIAMETPYEFTFEKIGNKFLEIIK